jgi:hypothetical protein
MQFDFGRSLRHADGLVFVEIALERASAVDRDFVGHDTAEAFNDGPVNLIGGVAWINNVTAHVTGDPNLFNLNGTIFVDGEVHNLKAWRTPGSALISSRLALTAFPAKMGHF